MSFDPITYAAVKQINTSSMTAQLKIPVFSSRVIAVPFDATCIIRAMSAGGSGAAGATASGGYSGAWGSKTVEVKAGDLIDIIIGAGRTRPTVAGVGVNGGDTTVTVGGITYTLVGGWGGKVTVESVISMPDIDPLWDYGARNMQPGVVAGGWTGGAGVDIFNQGGTATASRSVAGSGGGGTMYGSNGAFLGGGAQPDGSDALGRAPSNPPNYFDATDGEWGISFYGGSSGTVSGANGAGGAGDGMGGHGGNGGGGGCINNANVPAGNGGIGGGGAGNGGPTTVGTGGNGYAFIHLVRKD